MSSPDIKPAQADASAVEVPITREMVLLLVEIGRQAAQAYGLPDAALQSSSSAEAELRADLHRHKAAYEQMNDALLKTCDDVAAERDRATTAEAERDALRAENDIMRQALSFYADDQNYNVRGSLNPENPGFTGPRTARDAFDLIEARSALNHGKGEDARAAVTKDQGGENGE